MRLTSAGATKCSGTHLQMLWHPKCSGMCSGKQSALAPRSVLWQPQCALSSCGKSITEVLPFSEPHQVRPFINDLDYEIESSRNTASALTTAMCSDHCVQPRLSAHPGNQSAQIRTNVFWPPQCAPDQTVEQTTLWQCVLNNQLTAPSVHTLWWWTV